MTDWLQRWQTGVGCPPTSSSCRTKCRDHQKSRLKITHYRTNKCVLHNNSKYILILLLCRSMWWQHGESFKGVSTCNCGQELPLWIHPGNFGGGMCCGVNWRRRWPSGCLQAPERNQRATKEDLGQENLGLDLWYLKEFSAEVCKCRSTQIIFKSKM